MIQERQYFLWINDGYTCCIMLRYQPIITDNRNLGVSLQQLRKKEKKWCSINEEIFGDLETRTLGKRIHSEPERML